MQGLEHVGGEKKLFVEEIVAQVQKITVIIHLPLAHFPPTFLTHLPPVNEPFTPYV